MKYFVNEECIGCGLCNGLCSNVFYMNQESVAEAVDQEVDADDVSSANDAMNSCPVRAIEER